MLFRSNYIILEFLTTLCIVISTANSTPFFQNVPGDLINYAASASAAASSGQREHYTNIADLRRRHEKLQQMDDKHPTQENEDDISSVEEMNTNEATPNFLQKKINKIFYKLRLLSDLFHASNDNDNNEPTENTNFDSEMTTVKEYMETTEEISNITVTKTKKDVEQIPENIFQKSIYSKSENELPVRFILDTTEEEDNPVQNEIDSDTKKTTNRFGDVGIFLAEILGSIVALAYGAVMQFNHLSNGTPAPPNT